ncbi:hypothetical protein SZ52_02455 [Brachyspira hyodysenteriae]|uniref:hypothetical protein n=1 Tax=Brachyspira hyodysenteriae TaxID=159 RepID=UPI00063DA55B|nr:hypothetical protein [Brachyspira hyodysenteriae]KLI43948.1 hypothetical protein SZ52_02455 [Brachyspira hyodysenteriae]TVL66563.1 hypothetical protein A9X85_04320 [Brachyspira hyodysenteriae]TVL76073.1 hypothetical protein A9X79_00295 [Brachyspira hyodysenteriae]
MKKLDKYFIIPIILILSSIFANLFLDYYTMPKRFIGTVQIDQPTHFYDMKKWYESGKIPTTSTRFIASRIIDDEFNTPRVPGGAYYIFYTLFYKLASESLLGAKIINLIFNLIIISIFLFWFYKRFGLTILSFIAPLILCNGYFIISITDFWNPTLSLIFSFLLFIFLFEYINDAQEDSERKNIVKISAILIFPIIAVMAQGHFFVFFSLVPTIIIYLIIKYKRTLKYIKFFSIGVFLSFLQYLPYIISEFQSNFSNLNMIFGTRSGFTKFPFPQLQALLIFPTNEMSFFYGSKFISIVKFWNMYPIKFIGILFLFISIIFALICFFRAVYFSLSKKYITYSNNEKTIIDMMKIFLLFIPVSIVGNIFAGQFAKIHYLYQMFSLSFIPIILFFLQKENKIKNFLYIPFILIFINIIVMTLQITTYIKNYELHFDYNNVKTIISALYNDSKNKDIKVDLIYNPNYNYLYRDIAKIYFPDMIFNQVDNSTNFYIIVDMVSSSQKTEDSISNYMNYINTNSILITNSSKLYLYKYIGNESFRKP